MTARVSRIEVGEWPAARKKQFWDFVVFSKQRGRRSTAMRRIGHAPHHPFRRVTRFALEAIEKVCHHGDIDDEYEDLDWGWTVEDLVNLKGQERGSDHNGEPLGPALHKPQTDAFGQEQARIDETDDSEILDPVWRNSGDLLNCATHDATTWIEAEHRDPMLQMCRHIRVYQFQDAETHHEQRSGLQQLEDCDESNQSGLRGIHLLV